MRINEKTSETIRKKSVSYTHLQDEWEENLRIMGFFLGKFIYLLDAYEDVEKDAVSYTHLRFFRSVCLHRMDA